MNIDGTGLERLTRWRLNASNPDWSPDGQSIAFDSGDSGTPGSKGDIYVIRADGSGRTRLTDRPRFHEGGRFDLTGDPCWSPSGTQIMYTHFLPNGTGTLMAMNADGSDKHVVIDRPRTPNEVDWARIPSCDRAPQSGLRAQQIPSIALLHPMEAVAKTRCRPQKQGSEGGRSRVGSAKAADQAA